jgi:voltage-gated potassium channel Kch
MATRLVSIVPTVFLAGKGLRTGVVAALNLSQISEFSLVILALCAGYGHVSPELSSTILSAMLVASVLSTYVIQFNDRLARIVLRGLSAVGLREKGETSAAKEDEIKRDIALLGCYRVGQAFLDAVEKEAPSLKPRILVVDYNAALKEKLMARGFHWTYGDLAHPETLHHLGIEEAETVICSISDTFLKGITNRQLLRHLKRLTPTARFIMTAEEAGEAEILLKEGAHDVLVTGRLSAAYLFGLVTQAPRPDGAAMSAGPVPAQTAG